MIRFPRFVAAQFRAVVRRAKIGKTPGGYGPNFLLTAGYGRNCIRLRALAEDVAIEYAFPGEYDSEELYLPLELLSACESRRHDFATIERQGDQVVCQWTQRRMPQVRQYTTVPTDDLPAFPERPTHVSVNQPELWQALKDAAGVTDTEACRYALNCIQLRGNGQITATDGKQGLIQSGFEFPWDDDALMPASPVFGTREITDVDLVVIGRNGDWLMVGLKGWTIWLKAQEGRFPKVEDCIPDPASAATHLELADSDAEFLVDSLPNMPGDRQMNSPATVDLNGHIAIRGRGEEQPRPTELVLSNSHYTGQPLKFQTNRKFLAQAAQLGFRQIHLRDAESVAVAADDRRQYVWMVLDAASAIPASENCLRIESPVDRPAGSPSRNKTSSSGRPRPRASDKPSTDSTPTESDTIPMKPTTNPPVETNADTNAQQQSRKKRTSGSRHTSASPIEQALALRDALRTAAVQAGNLAKSLRTQKRQQRLVETTLKSLNQLQRAAG